MAILFESRSSGYGIKAGYRNQPSSYNDPTDVEPIYNNSDSSVYYEYKSNLPKAYNSAILITGENSFSLICFFTEEVLSHNRMVKWL